MYPKEDYWSDHYTDAIGHMGLEEEIGNLIAIVNSPIWGLISKDVRFKITKVIEKYAEETADKKIEEMGININESNLDELNR